MSTRCNIIVRERYGSRFILYRHHDGYPEGVGVQLRKALELKDGESFSRGTFGHYLVNDLIKDQRGLNDREYEITDCLHSDIDYLYVVNYRTKTLRCYVVNWSDVADFRINFKKVIRRKNLCEIPAWDGSKTMYED
jgi:hypothetical protein